MKVLEVGAGEPERLDAWLAHKLDASRSQVRALFARDAVRVDGRRAKAGHRITAGAHVSVAPEEPEAKLAPPMLRILWEDADLLFADKPAGVRAHPHRESESGTLADALRAHDVAFAAASENPLEGGLCHRLDTLTSGVLVAAKSRAAWTLMRARFQQRGAIEKKYLALAVGPMATQGIINLPLTQAGDHCRADGTGREALTHFTVKARRGTYAFVELQLVTGVMHQARAHCAAIGAPILGDELYGGTPWPGLRRFFLHAASLAFAHPTSGKHIRVTAPLPQDLRNIAASTVGDFPTPTE